MGQRGVKLAWASADWLQTDAEIGRWLGCTRQAVFICRKRLGKPPSPAKGTTVKGRQRLSYISKHPEMTMKQLAGALGMRQGNLWAIMKLRGLSAKWGHFRYPYESMNWSLSNRDLTSIWQAGPTTIAMARYTLKPGRATFDARRKSFPKSQLRKAIGVERRKAKSFFAKNPKH